ncbi:hypothetical protein GF367_00625 [Candidatus Woesearchaeota archaeon]|nr:hypothetical protein [Candidatus Woesearchaeota archaeon]
MSDEEVRPPLLPRGSDEKTGVFSKLFGKKKPSGRDVSLLKEELKKEMPKPLPEEAAEAQTEAQASPRARKRSADLERQLGDMKQSLTKKQRAVAIKTPDGKQALTLADLKRAVGAMTPEEFKKRQQMKDLTAWTNHELSDADLAVKLGEAADKESAIKTIDQALRTRAVLDHDVSVANVQEAPVEQQFEDLKQQQSARLDQLHAAVSQPSLKGATAAALEKLLVKKDETLIRNIHDLRQALELMDEETYQHLVTEHKEELVQRIADLAQRASQSARLNPPQLQAKLIKGLQAYQQSFDERYHQLRETLAAEVRQLHHQEEQVAEREEALKRVRQELKDQEARLREQQESWAADIKEQEERLAQQQAAAESFLQEQEGVVQQLTQREGDLDRREREAQEAYDKRQAELKQREAGLAEKKKTDEQALMDGRAKFEQEQEQLRIGMATLQAQREAYESEKKAYEERMQRREQLVQGTVDKIIAVDNDISSQRAEVEKMKREIDNEGFQKYLQHALKEIKTDHISFKDIPKPALEQEHHYIVTKIDDCTKAIAEKDFDKAKQLYDELRRLHEQGKLTGQEKDMVYDAVRELYADLHLAMLER